MRYSKDMEAENGHVNFKLVEIFRKGLCNGILKKIVFLFDQGRQSIMQVLIDLVTVFDALLCWRLQIEDADVCSAPFRSRFLKNSQNNRHHFGRFSGTHCSNLYQLTFSQTRNGSSMHIFAKLTSSAN
jgi:hypothetical protein